MPVPQRPLKFLPLGRIHAWWWAPIGLGVALADYLTGHTLPPPGFVPVIVVAAWYSGERAALPLAFLFPLERILFAARLDSVVHITPVRFVLGVSTLVLLAVIAGRLGEHERHLRHRIAALERLLPMCMWCKSIRNSDQQWERVEKYMDETGTVVSHGLCPDCERKYYPDPADRVDAGPTTAT